jgi:hypothetical protein
MQDEGFRFCVTPIGAKVAKVVPLQVFVPYKQHL